MIKISACVIVKNEIATIARCLQSVREVVNEMIVVDTGSTDDTVRIAKQIGARVFYFQWRNDFAAARNYALKQAKGDWIIFLDADEYFLAETVPNIRPLLEKLHGNPKIDAVTCLMENTNGVDGSLRGSNPTVRLFRNSREIRYEGKVHESIFRNGRPVRSANAPGRLIVIRHTGYTGKTVPDKIRRNNALLEEELQQGKGRYLTCYYLSDGYWKLGEYEKAIGFAHQAIEREGSFLTMLAYKPYVTLMDSMMKLRTYDEAAIDAVRERAIRKFPRHPEILFHQACFWMKQGRYRSAQQSFLGALEANANYDDIHINNEFYGLIATAHLNIAKIYNLMNEPVKALDHYVKALEQDRYNSEALRGLLFRIAAQNPAEVVFLLNRLYHTGDAADLDFLVAELSRFKTKLVLGYYQKIRLERFGRREYGGMVLLSNGQFEKAFQYFAAVFRETGARDAERLAVGALLLGGELGWLGQLGPGLNPSWRRLSGAFFGGGVGDSLTGEDFCCYLKLVTDFTGLCGPESLARMVCLGKSFFALVPEEYYFKLGEILVRQELFRQALEVYLQPLWAKSLGADRAGVYYFKAGFCRYKMKDYRGAARYFTQALDSGYRGKDIQELMEWASQRAAKKLDNVSPQSLRSSCGSRAKDEPSTVQPEGTGPEPAATRQRSEAARSSVEDVKRNYKQMLEKLIQLDKIAEAKYMVHEYEKKLPADSEIVCIKAVIAVREGKSDEAGEMILSGLSLEPLNGDLLYNLASVYEIKNKLISAYRIFQRLSKVCGSEISPAVNDKLAEYEKLTVIREYNQRKKVLIIAYIFPPLGGSGVQRTLKFIKYLREFGWEPIVVTVGEANFYFRDETMLSEIPEDLQILRIHETSAIGSQDVQQLLALYQGVVQDAALMAEYIQELNRSKENFKKFIFLPEQRIVWAKTVLDKIPSEIDFEAIDGIYTTSGPYSDHIVGFYLQQKYGKPWVADFRDEWTNNPYLPHVDKRHIVYKIQRRMEEVIVNNAHKVLSTTELAAENYIKGFRLNREKVVTITNGYDEDDFQAIGIAERERRKFTIVHNGIFYMIRTPETFLQAIRNLIRKKLLPKAEIEIAFTSTDNEEHWKRYVEELNLAEVVTFHGYLSHQDSLTLAAKADLLLLVVGAGESNKAVYTGKVFEYLRLSKPILALSPRGSLVEALIQRTGRGENINFNDIEGMENYLLRVYRAWREGKIENLPVTDEVKQYERRELTKRLSEILNEIAASNGLSASAGAAPRESERNDEFYDRVYKTGGWNQTYFKRYSETHYFPMWVQAVEMMKAIPEPNIIDIGCGPGQFAEYLFDQGMTQYRGIDFSVEAIQMAKIRNDRYRQLFRVDNAYTTDIFDTAYNTVVLFEVLEHIEDDLKVLERIREGAQVLFSVPDFHSAGHVRWFDSEIKIIQRYQRLIRIGKISTFAIGLNTRIYLIRGIKN